MNFTLTNSIGTCCVVLAVALQGYWLSEVDTLSRSGQFLVGFIAVSAGGAFVFFSNSTIARSTIITISAGGLGMLIGMSLDGSHLHIHHASYLAMIPTWMTVFMVLFCLPVCCFFCRHSGISRAKSLQLHCLATVTMVAGMLLGSVWFSGSMTQWLGTPLLGHYIAMLVGMSIGTAAGLLPGFKFSLAIKTDRCQDGAESKLR